MNLRLAKLSKICQLPPKIYLFCRALENYTVVARQGDDGTKPDFMARKSCNFITESVEVDLQTFIRDTFKIEMFAVHFNFIGSH